MMVDKVAKRYAISFFRAVENLREFNKISSQLESLSKLIKENKQFNLFLKSPVITKEKKIRIIEALFKKRFNNLLLDFLIILTQNNREYALGSIIKEFLNLKDIKENILRVKVFSAVELGTKEKRYILTELEKYFKKKIIADFSVDTELIGGLKIFFDDYVLDGSVKRQLELLESKLNEYTLI
ncbi:MAG: ATP synthase F1 subunit delta [Ignavibacteria bacterium]|nr:ATP synthase F1 subunit delta [Ignavibacteria bacterium]